MPEQESQAKGQALKYWAFTANAGTTEEGCSSLVDPETLKTFFSERTYIERWVFQKERASRDHYQGKIDCKDKKDKNTVLGDLRQAGIDTGNFTLRPVSNNGKQAAALDFYCTKIETRIDGPWTDPSFIRPKKRKTYEGKDLAMMEHPLQWQKAVLDWLEAPADDRTIRWIWNENGNAGKSKLIKWLCWLSRAAKIPMGTATQLKTAVCDKGDFETYLVDLPRVSGNQESARDLFSALEDIKNGFVETAMYGKPRTLFMEPPHVIIFSNDLPDLRLASADRWKVYSLEDQDDFLHYMTPGEVRRRIAERLEASRGTDPGAAL